MWTVEKTCWKFCVSKKRCIIVCFVSACVFVSHVFSKKKTGPRLWVFVRDSAKKKNIPRKSKDQTLPIVWSWTSRANDWTDKKKTSATVGRFWSYVGHIHPPGGVKLHNAQRCCGGGAGGGEIFSGGSVSKKTNEVERDRVYLLSNFS